MVVMQQTNNRIIFYIGSNGFKISLLKFCLERTNGIWKKWRRCWMTVDVEYNFCSLNLNSVMENKEPGSYIIFYPQTFWRSCFLKENLVLSLCNISSPSFLTSPNGTAGSVLLANNFAFANLVFWMLNLW